MNLRKRGDARLAGPRRKAALGLALIGLMLMSSWGVLGNSASPQDQRTHAPGEGCCCACHELGLNVGPGKLSIAIPTGYEPSKRYTLIVTIEDAGMSRWGFEVAVKDNSSVQAGDFVVTNTLEMLLSNATGVQYIKQKTPGTHAGVVDKTSWSFDWVAPAFGAGTVTFYAASVSANNDGTDRGDYIYGINKTCPEIITDSDGDGLRNEMDPDDDNDGVLDASDAFPLDPAARLDTDKDGRPDELNGTSTTGLIEDLDDDNDAYNDTVEVKYGSNPKDKASVPPDMDHDFIPDAEDPDKDGDGVANDKDPFPNDPAAWLDTDKDGKPDELHGSSTTGLIEDLDDDNDSYNDSIEVAAETDPKDPLSKPVDSDGDGIPDVLDTDDDNDGVPDAADAFPLDPAAWQDTDGDGMPDELNGTSKTGLIEDLDDDSDGYNDTIEVTEGKDPKDNSSKPADMDNDLIPDDLDPERDGDGVVNEKDAFPLDPTAWLDTDKDGMPDELNGTSTTGLIEDLDDDNDGFPDTIEKKYGSDPKDKAFTPPDLDNDLIPDAEDDDRDGDGKKNDIDAFPDDQAAWIDTDKDGKPDELHGNSTTGLVEDLDDDDDVYSDVDEIAAGTDPKDPDSKPKEKKDGGKGIPYPGPALLVGAFLAAILVAEALRRKPGH